MTQYIWYVRRGRVSVSLDSSVSASLDSSSSSSFLHDRIILCTVAMKHVHVPFFPSISEQLGEARTSKWPCCPIPSASFWQLVKTMAAKKSQWMRESIRCWSKANSSGQADQSKHKKKQETAKKRRTTNKRQKGWQHIGRCGLSWNGKDWKSAAFLRYQGDADKISHSLIQCERSLWCT